MLHPYPYQLFAYLVGFVIIFRTQQSYQRFWEARTALQQMSSKWIDSIVMSLAFDRPLEYGSYEIFFDHVKFAYRLVEYMSLLHALAMMDVYRVKNKNKKNFCKMFLQFFFFLFNFPGPYGHKLRKPKIRINAYGFRHTKLVL